MGVLASFATLPVLVAVVVGLLVLIWIKRRFFRPSNYPPYLGGGVPILGQAINFSERPIDYLIECYNKAGPVFSFNLLGSEVTYLIGSEATANFWSSHNDALNAEDLYRNITVPVFGAGVAYDCPHKVFSEQKQLAKDGLTADRYQAYTHIVEEEAMLYMKRWKESGTVDLFTSLSEMIIFTATRCLHGQETRDQFTDDVAALYHDLDEGFTAAAWLLPHWLPLPSFLRRNRAHAEIKKRFKAIIANRRKSGDMYGHSDLLETFMTKPYQKVLDKRNLNDDEISGMLIALLMAGQHTSSTSSAWLGFFMCACPGLQDELVEEQRKCFEDMPGPLTLEHLEHMPLLHSCVRETLRLRPPIMTMMRKVRKPFEVEVAGRKYVIPAGNQVCVSPTVNGRITDEWDDPDTFNPRRFLREEKGRLVVTTGESKAKNAGKFRWVPFGAGRHRCIGFDFAQIQIRAVWSSILRNYEIELPSGKVPGINYKTMIHTPLDSTVNYHKRKNVIA